MSKSKWKRIVTVCIAGFLVGFLAVPTGFKLRKAVSAYVPVDGMEGEPEKVIALTFDDGPRRKNTTLLLDALAKRQVKATFFLIGNQVSGCEDLILRMQQEGHQIGLHTHDHVILSGMVYEDFEKQIKQNKTILEEILGKQKFMIRPPYGTCDANICRWSDAPLIGWSIDPQDWKDHNSQRMMNIICRDAEDGGIILMHDLFSSSVDAAMQSIDRLTEQGYRFVTVEELFALRGVKPENGTVYTCLP